MRSCVSAKKSSRNQLETNPYQPPSARVTPATRKPRQFKRSLFTCVFAFTVILIFPFPAINVMVGGLAGTMLAQVFFVRRVGGQVIGGFVGGGMAIVLSLLVSVAIRGGTPQLVTSWWDLGWLRRWYGHFQVSFSQCL